MSDDSRTPPAPTPHADREGDEEQTHADERRIQEEIAEQKDLIDAISGDTSEDALHRAPHKKKLGRLELKYEIIVEKKRLARELLKLEEMHGAIYSEPCLICLEDIHVDADASITRRFGCCGGFICIICSRDMPMIDKCPLCREPMFGDSASKNDAQQFVTLAKRGVAWAQADVGRRMIEGNAGLKKQEKTGLEWLNKAAAQNCPFALSFLSSLYRTWLKSLLRKSQEKANELLLKSANLGFCLANSKLADFYFGGSNGFETDQGEAYFRASVALALVGTDQRAVKFIGCLHLFELNIPEPLPRLACYYLNVAANEDKSGMASFFYSQALLRLAQHVDSDVALAGIFWLRKSRDMGHDEARELLNQMVVSGKVDVATARSKHSLARNTSSVPSARPNGIAVKNVRLRRGGLDTRENADAPQC